MFFNFLALIILTLNISASDWELIWQDEFNEDKIDSSKWRIENAALVKNNEKQYYSEENVFIKEGALIIKSEVKENFGRPYTSGLIESKDRFIFQYGRVDVRAKIPKGQGIWPAIWMLNSLGIWPPEIDIMESVGHEPDVIHMTHHFRIDGHHRSDGNSFRDEDFSNDYHVYSIIWDKNHIKWSIDGVKRFVSKKNIPQVPFYLIINTAVGGDWPGSPDESTVFPQFHYVDYVRVYRKNDSDSFILLTNSENGRIIRDNDEYSYSKGSRVKLEALPFIGYDFDHWEGDIRSDNNPVNIMVNKNLNIKAVFKKKKTGFKLISEKCLTKASSVEADNLNSSYAVDGQLNTRWSSEFSDPQWIELDLKKPYRVEAIRLNWENAYAREFYIQTSINGVKWDEIIYEKDNYLKINEYYTPKHPARFIRIYGVKRGTSWGYSLWEVEVFGNNINH